MIDLNRLIFLPMLVVCFVLSVVLIVVLARWVQMNDEPVEECKDDDQKPYLGIPSPRVSSEVTSMVKD